MLLADLAAGKRNRPMMNRDLNIPQNRVRMSNELRAKDDKPTDFVRDMTHELRTPLNAIIGLCQCLERDHDAPLTEGQRDTVLRIERNAHALLDSANQLLARLRTGKY